MEKNQSFLEEQDEQQRNIFKSFRASRVLIPIILGLGAGIFMFYKNFNAEVFNKIQWTTQTFFWIGIALLMLVIRHLLYSLRLYILADGTLTFRKCVELLFVWEFSTAVTPTSAGGAAVALFVLTLEKIPPARTAIIVIYKVLLDSIFYLILFPLLFLALGFEFISPETIDFNNIGNLGYTFLTVYGLMAIQGGLLFYGVFFNPKGFQRLLDWGTRLPLLKRFHDRAIKFGEEVAIASTAMVGKPMGFHYRAFGVTAAAWTCRFMMVNALIFAIYEDMDHSFHTHAIVFGRITAMYVVTLFAPSPGGAGFAEVAFIQFLSDKIPATLASLIGITWRFMSHYAYLIIGGIIVPNWIRRLIERKKQSNA